MALNLARNSQTKLPCSAINVAPLKLGRGKFKKFRDALQIGLGQVDKPFLGATIRATRLALEAKAFHTEAALTLDRN
jgi:hypothetical protein